MPASKLDDPRTDPVLQRFRTALEAISGEHLERIVLFGSRARGEASAESDYDVAVFLKDLFDRRVEQRRIAAVSSERGGRLVKRG